MPPQGSVATEELKVVEASLEPRPLSDTPEQTLLSFVKALGSCDLDAAAFCFTRDASFLTRTIPTQMFNGYGDQVASMYAGMDLKKNY